MFHILVLFVSFFPVIVLWIMPWMLAFTWLRRDARRRRLPGLLWALVTLPLGWLGIVGYLIMRSTRNSARAA
jgi:hypothetical protein